MEYAGSGEEVLGGPGLVVSSSQPAAEAPLPLRASRSSGRPCHC
jgi:hypothetical protein